MDSWMDEFATWSISLLSGKGHKDGQWAWKSSLIEVYDLILMETEAETWEDNFTEASKGSELICLFLAVFFENVTHN